MNQGNRSLHEHRGAPRPFPSSPHSREGRQRARAGCRQGARQQVYIGTARTEPRCYTSYGLRRSLFRPKVFGTEQSRREDQPRQTAQVRTEDPLQS